MNGEGDSLLGLKEAPASSSESGSEDEAQWHACLVCYASFKEENRWTEHWQALHANDRKAQVLVLSRRDLSPEIRIRPVHIPPPNPKMSNEPTEISQWRKTLNDGDGSELESGSKSTESEQDDDEEEGSVARRRPSAHKLRPRSSKSYRFESSSSSSSNSTESGSEEDQDKEPTQTHVETADGGGQAPSMTAMAMEAGVNGHEKENQNRDRDDEQLKLKVKKKEPQDLNLPTAEKMDVEEHQHGKGKGKSTTNGAPLIEATPMQQHRAMEELTKEAAAAYGQSVEVRIWREESIAAAAVVQAQAQAQVRYGHDHDHTGFGSSGYGYFGGEVICPVCWRRFKSRSQLKAHINLVHYGYAAPILCPTCGVRFATPKALRIHVRRAHRPKKESFTCKICDCVFICERNLFRHRQRHHQPQRRPKQPVTAPVGVAHAGDPPAAVEYDYAELERLEELEEERRQEEMRLKPVPCQHCDRRFRLERHLHLHMLKMHPGLEEPRPRAPREPSKEVAMGSVVVPAPASAAPAPAPAPSPAPAKPWAVATPRLEAPLEGHTQPKSHANYKRPFHCETCGKTFRLAAHLRVHLVSHETPEEKRYQCPICLKRFGLPHHLKQHAGTHRHGQGQRRGGGLGPGRRKPQPTQLPVGAHAEAEATPTGDGSCQ